MNGQQITKSIRATNLADILELVLDKGIVIAGDIQIKLAEVDLINIKIRLLICSVEKAKELGISWWEQDSYLSPAAKEPELAKENRQLAKRIESLEAKLSPPVKKGKIVA